MNMKKIAAAVAVAGLLRGAVLLGRVVVGVFFCVALLFEAPDAQAGLLTYNFSGHFNSESTLFNANDRFSGSYTFSTDAQRFNGNPDDFLTYQYTAINNGHPGTGWQLHVLSSKIAHFDLSGAGGVLAIGNDVSNNGYVADRYIATLGGSGLLPTGLRLNFFQLDLLDRRTVSSGTTPGLIGVDSVDVLPVLDPNKLYGGRFFILNPTSGCDQCGIIIDSLSSAIATVPEPGSLALLGLGLAGLAGLRRRQTQA